MASRIRTRIMDSDEVPPMIQILVDEYISNGLNLRKAYQETHPDADADSTAQAYYIWKQPGVQKYLSEQIALRGGMSKNEALIRLSDQARADVDDFLDKEGNFSIENARANQVTGAIKKLKVTERTEKSGAVVKETTFELIDTIRAKEILLKAHGALIDNVNLTTDSVKNMSTQELEEYAKTLAK